MTDGGFAPFIPPVRTDAAEADPYDALRPGTPEGRSFEEAGLVVRDETDAEIAARKATEHSPPAPDPAADDRQSDLLHRARDLAGGIARAAVGVVTDAAQEAVKTVKPQVAYGIECRNGIIVQFLGRDSAETLAARRQHLLDARSERSVEVVADAGVYQLMAEHCARLPDDAQVKVKDLFLNVAEAMQRQATFDQLKLTMGSRKAFVAVMGCLPPSGETTE
jgi:hypothetical protein